MALVGSIRARDGPWRFLGGWTAAARRHRRAFDAEARLARNSPRAPWGAPQGALSRSLGSSTERGTLPHERILWTAATPSEVSVHSPLTARVPDLPADRDRYLPHEKTFPHKRIFRTASKNFFRIKRITIAPSRRPRAGVPPS